jgi:hypothetical protein
MAIQNAIYSGNRITKKKYFYSPSLEKPIKNVTYSLDRDSSMDDQDYKDICFCPLNNKLYAVRNHSSTGVSYIDVICPNSTTATQSPQASIEVEDYCKVLIYCPSVKRILALATTKVQIINPQSNTVESSVAMGSTWTPSCAAYNPINNKVYIGSPSSNEITVFKPGKISYSGVITGATKELTFDPWATADPVLFSQSAILLWSKTSSIHKIEVNPERNELYCFANPEAAVSLSNQASNISISLNKEGSESYSLRASMSMVRGVVYISGNSADLGSSNLYQIVDVIYCPYDGESYWLAAVPNDARYPAKIIRTSPDGKLHTTMTFHLKYGYDKLIYCPDNNMIYALEGGSGLNNQPIAMINPADKSGLNGRQMPVTWVSATNQINTNSVCFSPVNNRIYGVGDAGSIKYIQPTA